MKLPGRTEGAVQQLGSVDPGVYTQRGEAFAGMVGVAADTVAEWHEKKAVESNKDAILEVTAAQAKTVEQYGLQRTYSQQDLKDMKITDLPKTVTHREIVRSGGDSDWVKREEIEAEDVWPEYMARQSRKQIAVSAKNVIGSTRRKDFERRQEVLLVEKLGYENAKAFESRERKLVTKVERDIANSETAGDFPAAMMQVRLHPTMSPEEQDTEIIRLLQEQEKYRLFTLKTTDIYHDDGSLKRGAAAALIPELQREIDRINHPDYGRDEDGDFENSLTVPQREVEVSSLKAMQDGLRASLKGDTKQAEAAAYVSLYQAVDDGTPLPQLLNQVDAMAVQLGLSGSAIGSLREFVKDGAKYKSDRVSDLNTLADGDPEGFIKAWEENGVTYRMDMPPDMHDALQGRYDDIKLGRTEGLSDTKYTNLLIESSGLDTTGDPDDANVIRAKRAEADFRALASKLIKEAEQAAGRKLTGEERRVLIREARDATLTPDLVNTPKEYTSDTHWLNEEITSRDVPKSEELKIRAQVLKDEDEVLTADEVTEIYADNLRKASDAERAEAKRLKKERKAAEKAAEEALDGA